MMMSIWTIFGNCSVIFFARLTLLGKYCEAAVMSAVFAAPSVSANIQAAVVKHKSVVKVFFVVPVWKKKWRWNECFFDRFH